MDLATVRQQITEGEALSRPQAEWLYQHATDAQLSELATSARDRWHAQGKATYLVMAIVNYTNICVARCDYCAFYRLPGASDGYLLTLPQVFERIDALRHLGGTMVGFNGGFHPKLRIDDYGRIFQAVRERYPELEFYEMTVSEFVYSCKVSQLSYTRGAQILADHGVRWVTGGGSEILDEAFRQRHSPLKHSVDDYYDAQRALLDAGLGSTATMVIGFDETLQERMNHLERLRAFQDEVGGQLPSFLCWTYKPHNTALGGEEIPIEEYLRWLAICRLYLHNFAHIRTSVLTRNEGALRGLCFGADDFDIPTEDEVTQEAGATIHHDFERILEAARAVGYEPIHRDPLALPSGPVGPRGGARCRP
ncbi:MAG TPA: radical SAM protein [Deltaproteobacteria bacterium]|nr:radical SAM protein [Deltaproteobacteria bacterium]